MPSVAISYSSSIDDECSLKGMQHTFDRLRQRERERYQENQRGKMPKMDRETLRELCVENGGYETPELNDSLYAHFHGFQKIEGLNDYFNLKCLWLDSNGLVKIENLDCLVHLRCLYLGKNMIESLENLGNLQLLSTLDVSDNRLSTLTGIAKLANLQVLNVSGNLLVRHDDVSELTECSGLSNLDISHNQLVGEAILKTFAAMQGLRALRVTGNPIVSKTRQFRKQCIASMPQLAFLDRPIFPIERASVNAWAEGGHEAEVRAREAFKDNENQERKQALQDFRVWQQEVRQKHQDAKAESGLSIDQDSSSANTSANAWTDSNESLQETAGNQGNLVTDSDPVDSGDDTHSPSVDTKIAAMSEQETKIPRQTIYAIDNKLHNIAQGASISDENSEAANCKQTLGGPQAISGHNAAHDNPIPEEDRCTPFIQNPAPPPAPNVLIDTQPHKVPAISHTRILVSENLKPKKANILRSRDTWDQMMAHSASSCKIPLPDLPSMLAASEHDDTGLTKFNTAESAENIASVLTRADILHELRSKASRNAANNRNEI